MAGEGGPAADLVVLWRVTERCDTHCGFCAYDARLGGPRHEAEGGEVLRFGRLASRWAATRGRRVLLSFLGGEPFLWPPLAQVATALRAEGLALSLTSNGRALADPGWRAFVLEALDELTLSLDGPPALHDRLRGRAGLAATVLFALSDLRSRRGPAAPPRLRVNTVLMRDNSPTFAELVALVAEAGADELTFNALGGRDRPEYFGDHRLAPADVAAVAAALPAVRAGAGRRGLLVRGGAPYLARLRASAGGEALPVAECWPGRSFWFVETDGRLSPCHVTAATASLPVASLRTPADLDALPARLAAARVAARPPACLDCPSTQVHAKWETA